MRLVRVLTVFAALALFPAAAARAQDSTAAARPRAPRAPHRTDNRPDCLQCHRQGNTEQVKAMPAEHDYPVERCARCHRPAENLPPGSRHAFDADHADCLHCHVAGNTVDARPAPDSHSRYTPALCAKCHEPQTPG